jgi:hypothetical protein
MSQTPHPAPGQPPTPDADRRWFVVGRLQEFEGEARANIVRMVAVAAFYSVAVANFHGLRIGPLEIEPIRDKRVHEAITVLAAAWAMLGLAVFACLRERVFPLSLKYFSTACDIVLLTFLLIVTDGPRGAMTVGYFVVLGLAAQRFSLPLVRFSAVGCAAGYLVVLGYARWFSERDIRVPRYRQIVFLIALVLTAVLLGQIVRRVRAMAEQFAAPPSTVPPTVGESGSAAAGAESAATAAAGPAPVAPAGSSSTGAA